ncbi:hypothetical protein NOX90_02785 [Wolbachia endosymbiont of Anurida maritima]|uniref:hypothetical protein n=1 Tax=Wolbachia endosymbiont of Anurida maritima TaxID=2850562 RepID=UPI0035CF6E4A
MILQNDIDKPLGDYITKAKEEKETDQPFDMSLWNAWFDSPRSDEFNKTWESYCSDEFDKIWQDHFDDIYSVTDDQRTDAYKETLRKLYDAGQKCGFSLPEKGDVDKEYRPFVKGALKEMFRYAGAETHKC